MIRFLEITPYLAALITVTITATAQIFLKHGITITNLEWSTGARSYTGFWGSIYSIGKNPFILGGIAFYGISTLLWIYVLSRMPLSRAYPFVGLSIVFTSIAGALLLGERLVASQVVGIVLVSVGVLLVAKA